MSVTPAAAPRKDRAAAALDRLELGADRAQARRRRDHRLGGDHHRGDPLEHRPRRLGHRVRLGAQGRRAGRRGAPLRPLEDREPRRGDRGDADPRRLRGDRRSRRSGTWSPGSQVDKLGFGIAVIAFSGLVNLAVSAFLARRARQTESAGARGRRRAPAHRRAAPRSGCWPGWCSSQVTGAEWIDPAVALVVAAAIVVAGVRLITPLLARARRRGPARGGARGDRARRSSPSGRAAWPASTSCARAAAARTATSTCTSSSARGRRSRRRTRPPTSSRTRSPRACATPTC